MFFNSLIKVKKSVWAQGESIMIRKDTKMIIMLILPVSFFLIVVGSYFLYAQGSSRGKMDSEFINAYGIVRDINNDICFVPLYLKGPPSKNQKAIKEVLQYMKIQHGISIFQIEYTEKETVGIWFSPKRGLN